MSNKLSPIAVFINPSEIVVFKFILESYEGLAELRTLNSQIGKILLLATEDTKEDAMSLLESLKEQLSLAIAPEDKIKEFMQGEDEDWLTKELDAL